MELPEFDKFLTSIDVDDVAEKYAQTGLLHLIQLSTQDPKALGDALAIVYQEAVRASLNRMTVFLAEYHSWLRKQI